MPICKKCNNRFPNRIKINEKFRILNKRKYCLECSPFGKHNTSNILDKSKTSICKHCKREYEYDRKKGHRIDVCNSCYTNKRRFKLKEQMIEYKGGKCQKCGYDKKIYSVYEFHHIDSDDKEFSLGGNHSLSWEKIKKELEKCMCLCCLCHRELHSELVQDKLVY